MRQDVGGRGSSVIGSVPTLIVPRAFAGLLGRRLLGRRPSWPWRPSSLRPSSAPSWPPPPAFFAAFLAGAAAFFAAAFLAPPSCDGAAFAVGARLAAGAPAGAAFLAAARLGCRRDRQLGHPAGRVQPGQHEGAHLALLQDLAGLGRRRRAHGGQRDVAVQRPPPGSGTSTIAPCDVNDTTSPSMVLPTGKAATKLMNVSGSLTAGGGVGRCFWCRPPSSPGGASPLASARLPSEPPPDGGVLLGLGPLLRRRLLGRRVLLGGAPGLLGWCRRVQRLLDRLVDGAREHRVDLGPARGRGRGRDRPRRVDRGAGACFVALLRALDDFLAAFLAALASSAALAGADSGSFFALASAVAARLLGPRMGSRGVKIHPTPGTGLPPISRPSSKSHGCSPWNSWKESLDSTVAPVRSAIRSTNASPRPMAPAGGEMISPLSMAWRTSSRSASVHPVLEGGVDHDDDAGVRVLGGVRAHSLVELL